MVFKRKTVSYSCIEKYQYYRAVIIPKVKRISDSVYSISNSFFEFQQQALKLNHEANIRIRPPTPLISRPTNTPTLAADSDPILRHITPVSFQKRLWQFKEEFKHRTSLTFYTDGSLNASDPF